jgi:parvulin-like peptidyl-prolyl isomerase
LGLVGAVACKPTKPPKPAPRPNVQGPEQSPIATVNGEEIPLGRFNLVYAAMARRVPGTNGPVASDGAAARLKTTIALQLIEDQLVFNAAHRRAVTIPSTQVDSAVRAFAATFADQAAYRHYVAVYPEQAAGVRRTVELQLLKETLAGVTPNESISEADARAFYAQSSTTYNVPAHLRALEIVLPPGPDLDQRVTQVAALLANPKVSFSAIAHRFSGAEDAKVGGEMGQVTRNSVEPAIWATLNKLKLGEISPPLKTPAGVRFFKLIDRHPATSVSFDDARPGIERSLRLRRRNARIAALMTSLRAQAKIDNRLAARLAPYLPRAERPFGSGMPHRDLLQASGSPAGTQAK